MAGFPSVLLHQATGKTWCISIFSLLYVAKDNCTSLRQSLAPFFICNAYKPL